MGATVHSPQEPGLPAPAPSEAVSNLGRLAVTIDRLRRQIQEAQRAAEGRALIEVAKGILIERLQCGLAEAPSRPG